MNKLMIAAAVAAISAGAFADAQVYEYKLTLTSTTCREGTVAGNTYYTQMGIAARGDEISYRTPAKITILGVAWGCDCDDAFAGAWNSRTLSDGRIVWDGLTFWEKTSGEFLGGVYNGTEIAFNVFNRIGKKANEIEMTFDIVPSGDAIDTNFELTCAGQGTIRDAGLAAGTDCEGSYIKSAKGSVAGFISPGSGNCYYCDDIVCDVYDFCDCLGIGDDTKTIAYGSWTMKYNAAASRRLRTTARITSSYSGFARTAREALVAAGE